MQYVLVYSIEVFESQQKIGVSIQVLGHLGISRTTLLGEVGFPRATQASGEVSHSREWCVHHWENSFWRDNTFMQNTKFWFWFRFWSSLFWILKVGRMKGFLIPTWVLRYSKLVSLKVLAWVCGDLVGLVSWKKSWATLTDALDAKVRICFSLQFFDFGKTISIERNFFICGTCRVAVAWGRITLVLRHHAGSVGDHPFATSQSPVPRVVGSDRADPGHCFASFAQPLAFNGFGKIKKRFPSFCCLAGGVQFKFQWFHFSEDPSWS